MIKISSKIILPIVVAVSVIVTVGIMFAIAFDQQPEVTTNPTPPQIVYVDKTVSEFFEGTQEIRKISSESELKDILAASSIFDGVFYDDRVFPTPMFDMIEETMALSEREWSSAPMAEMDSFKAQSGSDGLDYSTTNVQVENVDEPDYLKNDSKYVYIVSQNTLSIIGAIPSIPPTIFRSSSKT